MQLLLQHCLCSNLMDKVLHEEILEDHVVLFHFVCLLHESGGDDVLQEGANFQGLAHVGPLVIIGDHFKVDQPS